ncbi:hypothetical protein BDM02DRAFT_3109653 [Thelephora ganbajun]|uniref:Uncharacterized protein n=1 Tax=Thelephora ganbajun TaxID=370292 RepID=A0ACB6ZRG4_THEGA|nr:hypothetical protein BDM02DRAFT_3109653 [Thelephora ganbajun]
MTSYPLHLLPKDPPVDVNHNTDGHPQHHTAVKPRGYSVHSGLLPVPPVMTEAARGAYTLSDSSS